MFTCGFHHNLKTSVDIVIIPYKPQDGNVFCYNNDISTHQPYIVFLKGKIMDKSSARDFTSNIIKKAWNSLAAFTSEVYFLRSLTIFQVFIMKSFKNYPLVLVDCQYIHNWYMPTSIVQIKHMYIPYSILLWQGVHTPAKGGPICCSYCSNVLRK